MLKGVRRARLKEIRPMSIHGQISWDVLFVDEADPDGQVSVARLGPEAVTPHLEPGDPIDIEFLLGVPVRVGKRPL
jgi:hypothetical protein